MEYCVALRTLKDRKLIELKYLEANQNRALADLGSSSISREVNPAMYYRYNNKIKPRSSKV